MSGAGAGICLRVHSHMTSKQSGFWGGGGGFWGFVILKASKLIDGLVRNAHF